MLKEKLLKTEAIIKFCRISSQTPNALEQHRCRAVPRAGRRWFRAVPSCCRSHRWEERRRHSWSLSPPHEQVGRACRPRGHLHLPVSHCPSVPSHGARQPGAGGGKPRGSQSAMRWCGNYDGISMSPATIKPGL